MQILTIDQTKCQGHGRCALIDPDTFDVSDQGLGQVLVQPPAASPPESVTQAIENCPEQAISWVEA